MQNVNFIDGKYVTKINGKTVKRTNLAHLKYVMKKAGLDADKPAQIKESKFNINQRFGFLSDMVTMLAKGDQPSVVVTGAGGLGKSYTVMQALKKSGLKDMSVLAEYEIGASVPKNAFVTIKGQCTPKGLYRTLYPVSLNILKGALDSYSKRIISWRADTKDEELPQSFEFKGRVVFISNMDSTNLDQAILTRSMAVDVSMTPQQKIERMQYLLKQETFMPDYSMSHKVEALLLIQKLADNVKELSLRTLIQVTKIRKSSPSANWKDLAEYTICG